MRLTLLITIFLFFAGCTIGQKDETPSPKVEQKAKTVQKPKEIKKQPQIASSMVRGVIYEQSYNTKTKKWIYELKVIDIATDVIKRKAFTYPKKLYDVGDLVYAIFDKNDLSKLKNLYLIKKRYEKIKRKTIKRPVKKQKVKRTKANQTPWIGVPQTETVMLR